MSGLTDFQGEVTRLFFSLPASDGFLPAGGGALAHIDAELPQVDASTVWNRLREGEGFVTAMKTRISWIYSNLAAPSPLEKRLVSSSAGNSAVVGLRVPAPAEGYTLQAEVEERMGVRSIPKYASHSKPPTGPSA